jgi:hypothetical protein
LIEKVRLHVAGAIRQTLLRFPDLQINMKQGVLRNEGIMF